MVKFTNVISHALRILGELRKKEVEKLLLEFNYSYGRFREPILLRKQVG